MDWIKKPHRKKLLTNLLLLIVSLILMVVFAEIFVRLFTPKGVYSSSAYDDELGLTIYPGSKVIYNKARYTLNIANKDGFLDINHKRDDDQAKLEIAFLGDSYVEAMQVPIEQKFFRILPWKIANKEIEYFGFGISGNGTLSSYLNYKKQIRSYDLNIIVYVFVENDVGDNISMITKNDIRPSAKLIDSPPGFEIDKIHKKYNSLFFKVIRRIKSSSLLADLIVQRIVLLKQKGIVFKLNEEEKQMVTISREKIPDQNGLPSTWPPSIRKYAEKLAFNILKEWAKEVRDGGKEFVVLYVPRGEDILLDNYKSKDIFKGWLLESCSKLNIEVIDPSEIFIRRLKEGIQMYDDHWTIEGHKAVAQIIEEWLSKHFEGNNILQ